jgi:predicted nucleotidyltransferase
MNLNDLSREKREDILRLAKEYGPYNVRVFGSVARDEADEESDIDLLVTMESGSSLLDLIGLWMDLEELLQRKVDVVSEGGLKGSFGKRVLEDTIAL